MLSDFLLTLLAKVMNGGEKERLTVCYSCDILNRNSLIYLAKLRTRNDYIIRQVKDLEIVLCKRNILQK